MSIQKESRSPAPTGIERERESLYTGNDTTAARDLQPIVSILRRGKENRISTRDLVRMSGSVNSRSLQARISAEINRGAVILSTTKGGYFLPDNGDKGRREIVEYYNTLRRRALSTLKTVRTARKALLNFDEQLKLPGWGDTT